MLIELKRKVLIKKRMEWEHGFFTMKVVVSKIENFTRDEISL